MFSFLKKLFTGNIEEINTDDNAPVESSGFDTDVLWDAVTAELDKNGVKFSYPKGRAYGGITSPHHKGTLGYCATWSRKT